MVLHLYGTMAGATADCITFMSMLTLVLYKGVEASEGFKSGCLHGLDLNHSSALLLSNQLCEIFV